MRTHPHANRKPYEPNASAPRISRQRQILQQLSTDYAGQVEQLLGYRALMRGSLYRLHRRCGNPG
jgi:hypothetical protein